MKLENQVMELQSVVKKMKAENRWMMQAHRRELRWRDQKEIGLAIVVAALAIVYVVCALLIRGFV